MSEVNRKKVAANLLWRLLERCGAQGVTFIVSIIIARLVAPEVYGTIAIVTVIINLLQVFVDSGLGNSLIQKKESDSLDFSSVFYFNMVVCVLLYAVLYLSAQAIAQFYGMAELESVIKVLGWTLVISGVKNVQQAYVSKKLLFKKFFFATLVGTICAAMVGIYMAHAGYGIWALVAQNLINNFIGTVLLWITVKWRPVFSFSLHRLKSLWGFGWNLLLTSLLETLYNDLGQLIIGKYYSSASLAYYNKGKQFPNYIVTNINSSIKSVMFPVFSRVQDDIAQMRAMTRRSIKVSNYLISSLIIGMMAVAEPFITLLLTEQWLPCVPYLRLFSISFLFQPIQTTNKNVIKALGKGGTLFKTQLMVRIVGIILLIVTTPIGIIPMTLAVVATNLFEQILLAYENKKLIQYGYLAQCLDMLPAIVLSMIMGISVYFLHYLPLHNGIILLLQILLGVMIYIGGSMIFKNDSYMYILSMLRKNKEGNTYA